MKKTCFILAAIAIVSCSENKEKSKDNETTKKSTAFSTEGKKVLVYTTADSSDYKLSLTDTLTFTDKGQPVENEVTIFVDPGKTFQTFFGIGAALTDASAETFYKLPKDKQQEVLKA